jgi:hypothetical protein
MRLHEALRESFWRSLSRRAEEIGAADPPIETLKMNKILVLVCAPAVNVRLEEAI